MDGDHIVHTLNRYRRQLTHNLARFWQWWSGQLLGMLPNHLGRRLFRPRQHLDIHPLENNFRLVLEPGGEQMALNEADPSLLQQLQQQADDIRLCLPASELLYTRLRLPAATLGNLDNVLRFEMDKHTPFSADQVYFGFTAGPHDKQQPHIRVSLLLAPRSRIDPLLTELNDLGLTPATLRDAEHPEAPAITLPLSSSAGTARAGLRKNLNGILVMAMLLLLIAVPLYHRQNRIETLSQELDQPRQRAEQAAALKRELTALRDSRDFLGQKRAGRVPTLPLLDELTRQLPDHTWLTRLELQDDRVQIRGESANASELIGLLEASPLFVDVQFSSPITNNPATSKDRFMITASLVKGDTQ